MDNLTGYELLYGKFENTSGMGKTAIVPPEIKRWNWGAFFFSWFWGIPNRVYISLLTFVPLVGGIMPFLLGALGNEMAWRNRRWKSVADFQKAQRVWTAWGWVTLLLAFGAIVALLLAEKQFFQKYVDNLI